MNRSRRAISMMVVSATTAAVLVAAPNTAFAGDSSDTVSTSEIAAALSATDTSNGNLVAEPVASKTDTNSAAVTTGGETTVDVPKDASNGVSVTANGQEVSISLPNADDASNAQRLSDGTVAYAGTDGSANAVVPTSDGVQMLTTIGNADAPIRYTYDVAVPNGGNAEVTEDGRAAIKDSSGKVVALVSVPWAKDANGKAVPTHFESDGSTLTQVVDHTSGDYAYPITADPRFSWHWWGIEARYSKWETNAIGGSFGAASSYFGWTGAPGLVAWAALPAAQWATRNGYCLSLRFYYHRWPYPSFSYYRC